MAFTFPAATSAATCDSGISCDGCTSPETNEYILMSKRKMSMVVMKFPKNDGSPSGERKRPFPPNGNVVFFFRTPEGWPFDFLRGAFAMKGTILFA